MYYFLCMHKMRFMSKGIISICAYIHVCTPQNMYREITTSMLGDGNESMQQYYFVDKQF